MAQGATDKLFDYWKSKIDGGMIPSRSDIVMSEVTGFLPQLMILERSAKWPAFRLAGTDVCTTHRCELKGSAFRSLFAHQDRAAVDNWIEDVFGRDAVVRIRSRAKSEWGFAEFDTILLPLRFGEEGTARIVGAQTPTTTPASLWWRGSYNMSLHTVVDIEELAWRDSSIVRDPRLQSPAYEAPVLEFSRRGRPPEGRKVGHLTVIEGGARA